ncbi:hypothetical protein [Methylobacterium indicum]|uniref:hypothetical protein n=1 Tax=Methylobacterium indicum TaxID=1775910 RepID=UPI000AE12EEB|nr:hypothetical protein [Methylobacterium indicum]
MMPVEIDPSEVRTPRNDASERAFPRLGRPAMLAALAVVGIGGCAGLAAAAYPSVSALLRPRPSEVHFGRVADMPEIKDGIPALRTTPPPTVRKVEIPPATPPSAPVALLDPKPAGPPVPLVSPAADVAATGTALVTAPATVAKVPETPRQTVAARDVATPREAATGPYTPLRAHETVPGHV